MARLRELLNDPVWFPASLDANAGTIGFARISRDSLSSEAFLDQRMTGSILGRETAKLADVLAELSSRDTVAPAFIFHTAFCCSTLLARALDAPGTALALKEPDLLMGLANLLRVDAEAQRSREYAQTVVDAVFTLLARSCGGSEPIVVKPTNAANNLLPYAVNAGAKVVLLYGDLRSFLVSVLKKGEACKSFVRGQYNIFALDGEGLAAIPQRQAVAFTDLQAAALVWRHQAELFQRTLGTTTRAQLVSLDCKKLMAAPLPALAAVSQHFQLGHSSEALASIVAGPVFRRDAKFADREYQPEQVDREARNIEDHYGETLDLIEGWASGVSFGTALPTPLSGAIAV